ncbi:hypothetical protein LTR24_007456 [Lithohypha guttulata]|uniref:15-hydroxyprostaglandin dehydrogenase n=1 Tax=Lithohypha guttulata TaxID=1690604 RepID=A0ABR0K3E2_9EURO|nr:hypothetical protein LTR24_007456 [Lithohypha guttulata]
MSQHGPVDDFPLNGKIVLITGGGSGIGLAFTQLCCEAGTRVVIADLKLTDDGQKFVDSAKEGQVLFQKCDVSSWTDLHNAITASVKTFGEVPDVYAPVAGIFEPRWTINVEHPIKLTRLAMRALLGARKKGVVVLVASTAGIRGNYLASLYSASKHAIVGFTKSMGQADPEEGVRIVCVCPGLVDSPLWRDREDDMLDRAKFNERKAILPIDIAKVMVKMVESNEYSGGTCVLKTPLEERVCEKGWQASEEEYDPSPRPEADNRRVHAAMDKERGVTWQ